MLKRSDTLVSAQARFGKAVVVARELGGAEGETIPGWVIYPDQPDRAIDVFLDEAGKHPDALRIRQTATAWVRADGVRIGMRSDELQAMNGKPFGFSGFGWDYGGAITDWRGGKLDPKRASGGDAMSGSVALCPPEDAPQDYPSGEDVFSSDDARLCEFTVCVVP